MSVLPDMETLDLLSRWFRIGPRERRAVLQIVDRMEIGQKLFGELSYGKKDWKKEASEEAFDMCVYLVALLVDRDDEKKGKP